VPDWDAPVRCREGRSPAGDQNAADFPADLEVFAGGDDEGAYARLRVADVGIVLRTIVALGVDEDLKVAEPPGGGGSDGGECSPMPREQYVFNCSLSHPIRPGPGPRRTASLECSGGTLKEKDVQQSAFVGRIVAAFIDKHASKSILVVQLKPMD